MSTISKTTAAPESQGATSIKHRGLAVGGILILLAGVIAYLALTWGEVSTDDAQVDGRLVPVSAKISGHIDKLLVNDNQTVAKGELIARIDSRDQEVKVAQAQAALETTEAKSAEANAALSQAQSAVDKARNADMSYATANVADRKANYERAHADLSRMQMLNEKHEISQLQYDRYIADERVAKSQLEAAQQSLSSQGDTARIAEAAVRVASAKAEAARAQVVEARADLDAAKLDLSYAEIHAPQDGVITRRSVEVGTYVSPGQTLLTLVPAHDVWVTANFKETQLRNIRPGNQVKVKVDSLGKTLSARVDSLANATGSRMSLLPPENATGNFVKIVQRIPVKIVFDADIPQSGPLAVGANVVVTVQTY